MTAHAAESDFLIIGSGIAGLYAAVRLADHGTVNILTKRRLQESNTAYAQGGIAAVLAPTDSVDQHLADTLEAGAGLCDEEVVRGIVAEGPAMIDELLRIGVRFSRDDAGVLDLGREGGHTQRRIAHSHDRTGEEIARALVDEVQANRRIRCFEDHLAVDLILESRAGGESTSNPAGDRCLGAFVLRPGDHDVASFLAPVTLLTTGGAGKIYKFTSNPDIATGDGIAMAYRTGVRVANLEFVQFHPTCLYHHIDRSFLISEATRGEGARLTTLDGEDFMPTYDPRAELAPRDVVARAIDAELKRRGDPHVYLHLEHLDGDRVRERFPSIYARCLSHGIDITRVPIPVVPAAHYMCGGVVTDDRARTDLPGLLAAGEVAHTGMHGANRLASNSLLEAVVMAARSVESAVAMRDSLGPVSSRPVWDPAEAVRVREAIILEHDWNHVRALMWDYVGIVRSDERLRVAETRIHELRRTVAEYFRRYFLTSDLVELRNLALVGELIVRCARARDESRGLHFSLDHPDARSGPPRDTVIAKGEDPL